VGRIDHTARFSEVPQSGRVGVGRKVEMSPCAQSRDDARVGASRGCDQSGLQSRQPIDRLTRLHEAKGVLSAGSCHLQSLSSSLGAPAGGGLDVLLMQGMALRYSYMAWISRSVMF
jgi:hypothetical protein